MGVWKGVHVCMVGCICGVWWSATGVEEIFIYFLCLFKFYLRVLWYAIFINCFNYLPVFILHFFPSVNTTDTPA